MVERPFEAAAVVVVNRDLAGSFGRIAKVIVIVIGRERAALMRGAGGDRRGGMRPHIQVADLGASDHLGAVLREGVVHPDGFPELIWTHALFEGRSNNLPQPFPGRFGDRPPRVGIVDQDAGDQALADELGRAIASQACSFLIDCIEDRSECDADVGFGLERNMLRLNRFDIFES